MRAFTCKKCLRTFRVHFGPVPRDRLCSSCKFPSAPPARKGAPVTLADVEHHQSAAERAATHYEPIKGSAR